MNSKDGLRVKLLSLGPYPEGLSDHPSGGPGSTDIRRGSGFLLKSCLLGTYCAITVLENAKINMTPTLPLRMS